MSLSVRRLLGGATSAAAAALLVATSLSVAHADQVVADGDGLNGNTAAVRLGSICPGASASGTVGFDLVRQSSGNQIWANSTTVSITLTESTPASPNVTATAASATTPANWVTGTSGNADKGKTVPATSSTVTVAVPEGAAPGAQSTTLTFTGRGAGYNGGEVDRAVPVEVSWTVATTGCTPADSTPPDISYVLDRTPSASDWYAGPVSIDWTVRDPESPVTTTGCEDATQSAETDGRTFSCSARSAGGQVGPVNVTVRLDSTAPVVEAVVSGDQGADGWYTGDALLHWKVGDARSGLVDPAACPDVPVTTDKAQTSYSCTVTDRAGNTTTVSTTVKRDASAPVVSRTVTGTLGRNGWHTSPVDVDWTVTEGTSTPVALAGCEDTTVGDTAATTLTCVATNAAGLATTGLPVELKVDTVAPAATARVTGDEGDDGWYVGPVTVDWDATDGGGSGVAEGCDRIVQADDTTGTVHTCVVSDVAGNASEGASVTVRKDATAPVVDHDVDGTPGANGWYTSDVDVRFTRSDATSGVATTVGCDPEPLTFDTPGATYTCTVTDAAGNAATDEVSVKVDRTKPEVSHEVLGTLGEADWYTSDVAAVFTRSDAMSGLASDEGCDPTPLTDDSAGTTWSCRVVDAAGNEATDSVTVRRDATAPVVTHTVTGTPGRDGWYVSDVDVDFSVSDALAGVASRSGCDPDPLRSDTADMVFTCVATDAAGNATQDAVTVKRDATGPEVRWTAGPVDGGVYDFGDPLPATACEASDVTSGVTPDGCVVSAAATGVGEHTLAAAASDRAGNTARSTRRYTVRAWTIDGFYKPVSSASSVVNTVKAGSTVPLKFNVYKGGPAGTRITSGAVGAITMKKVGCDSGDLPDPVEMIADTGSTTLRYDGTQWIQNWATPSAGKGSCYRVTLTTADGSTTSATFLLK
ncbi:hypothetical protein EKO23_00625 [Nocardioides guangzhouensis]|uniref:Ig-like domain-containing protein n=1 Tax=Nocardioides guangzhouensis TaxID=2497878 RepID=A0A4Q4ZM04_9ACTN|nr:PxKF domain-containing protein [Nocardioides guangzhouensis]RYP88975.1 hypothetical protein EKO23_00625 [Nocardioides guangzhouensis]